MFDENIYYHTKIDLGLKFSAKISQKYFQNVIVVVHDV